MKGQWEDSPASVVFIVSAIYDVVAAIAIVIFLIVPSWAQIGQQPVAPTCGTERWDVKTLSDAAAPGFQSFTETTVEQLRAMKIPGPIRPNTPRYPAEKFLYTVRANLNEAKMEKDSDFHVVISGASGATMIAEFPDAACVAVLRYRLPLARARSLFIARYGQPTATAWMPIGKPATLIGMLFFDVLHGQRGVAPNGVELHPVLDLR